MKKRQNAFTLLEIMLVISIIVILLGVAINKLGNTTGMAKGVAVRADIQAISTQLKLYESMNDICPRLSRVLVLSSRNLPPNRDLSAGISSSRKFQKIRGAITTFIFRRAGEIPPVTISIPLDLIAKPTPATMIGVAKPPPSLPLN